MTRSFLAALVVGVAAMAMFPAYLQGCSQTGVGDPCIPEQEYDPTFVGFAAGEVNVESKSFDCVTRLCLANHFQGRVTCPYGQTKTGAPPALNGSAPYNDKNNNPIGACVLPGGGVDNAQGVPPSPGGVSQAVIGSLNNPAAGANATALVEAQCLQRPAKSAVYCSCRCANVDGKTDDGAVYCACPDGYSCTQLVTPIGVGDTGLTGAYCIQKNTDYDGLTQCTGAAGTNCDASKQNCGTFNGQ